MSLNTNNSTERAPRISRGPEHSWQLRLEDDRLITKNITNLSVGGMAFKAPHASAISTGQHLKFLLSVEPGQSYECEGQVLWTLGASEKPGAMRQFGVQFVKLPAELDAAIGKLISEGVGKTKPRAVVKGPRAIPQKIVMAAPRRIRSLLLKIFGAALVVALTSAFFVALVIHRDNGRSSSLANTYKGPVLRQLSSSTDR